MNKVHITLVGAQAAPVYNGIVATHPDEVVFIYSIDSMRSVDAVISEIDIPYEKILLSPIDPIEIKKKAVSLAEKYKDDKVTLNISSGLKSWSYLFGIVFNELENAEVVYMDQNNVLWNYKTMEGTREITFDMHTHFRLYGNSIEGHYKKIENYTEVDIKCIEKIEHIRRHNYDAFNYLVTILDKKRQNLLKNNNSGRFDHESGSYVEWQKTTKECKCIVHICLINKNKQIKEVKIESPNAVDLAFNSGWFEFKVAKLLSTWKKSQEVCLNCKFPFKKNVDKNEVDIIVNTGTKALFVECKTQIKNTTDIDKFSSVIKNYGGMGSKGLFITEVKMSEMAKTKCEEHKILTFSLADGPLGMFNEQMLHILLDSELNNINTQ